MKHLLLILTLSTCSIAYAKSSKTDPHHHHDKAAVTHHHGQTTTTTTAASKHTVEQVVHHPDGVPAKQLSVYQPTATGFPTYTAHRSKAGYDGYKDSAWTTVREVCYRGVTYLIFVEGEASTGSIMMDWEGHVVPCGGAAE